MQSDGIVFDGEMANIIFTTITITCVYVHGNNLNQRETNTHTKKKSYTNKTPKRVLTTAIAVHEMGKTPNIAQTHRIANAGKCEFQRFAPVASAIIFL